MNKLYYGDNLDVMRKFIRDETVDLCYIDPPFNSKRNYNQIYNNIGTEDRAQAQAFTDTWTWDDHANLCYEEILTNKNGVQTAQSIALINGLEKVLGKGSLFAYLVSMTVRIGEINRVLKPSGSFYFHCDPTASHYLKLVCDAIFVPKGGDYKNEVSWKRTTAHSDVVQGATHFGRIRDVIFYYTKSKEPKWNIVYTPYTEEYVETAYRYKELDGRRYQTQPLHAAKPGGDTLYEWKGAFPPKGRYWAFSKENMNKLDSENRIVYSKNGVPRYKIYLDTSKGIPLQDLWTDIPPIHHLPDEKLGYPTQKPEALLERIIKASTDKEDVVLDAFCGCGTTVAVAERLGRQWIGIDITYHSISLMLRRLKKVFTEEFGAGNEKTIDFMNTVELHGVPKDMESVDALIHKKDDRVRKEFEKWAILTYSDNRAVINEKKGADKGIDGIAYTRVSKNEVLPVIISVKSGNIGRKEVAQLHGDAQREGAACGILITRNEPTGPMKQEAKEAGTFKPEYYQPFDKLQIVTVQQILDGERMALPLMEEVIKKAKPIAAEQDRLIPE